MAYYNEFPHERNYDTDLGWLIRRVGQLNTDYSDILQKLEDLQNEYDTIPDVIASAIDEYEKNINQTIQNVLNQLKDTNNNLDNMENIVFSLKMAILAQNNALKQYIAAKYDELYTHFTVVIDNLVKEWPNVICPADGNMEDVQTALWHVYNALSLGIVVDDFDSLEIPVEEFDAMQIIVWEFDRYGLIIFQNRRNCYMFSPFTGKYVPISDVVMNLAELHMDGVTVLTFDNTDIEVSQFDSATIDVHTFDWTNEWINQFN